jgi:DNA recombination protein RmuC
MMNGIAGAVWFVLGLAAGLVAAYFLRVLHSKHSRELAEELLREAEVQRKAHVDSVIEHVKASFGNLSLDALARSTEEFLKLAKQKLDSEREVTAKELDARKSLIDQQLQVMTAELEKVSTLMQDLEKDRIHKFGELAAQLKTTGQQTEALLQTTNSLREALASTKVRGQWGERMAEDILRLAGFIENVNYVRQRTIEESGSRPDFTFLLPRDLKLNMDVKFPLDNYLRFLEAGSEGEKAKYRSEFLRDVKARIKEVTSREYISAEQNTVDSVLLFIPNEQVYAFIHEQDHSILDEAIRNRVVFCSPITLFAILAIIRKAVDNFVLERTSNEILSLLGSFKKQWDEFVRKLEQVGRRIGEAQKEYEALTTTRKRQLERPLSKIEDLRTQRGLPIASDQEADPVAELEKSGEVDRIDP